MTKTAVSLLGAGQMGSVLGRELLASGHPITVWSRNPERCEPLRQAGARVAESPLDAVEGADVVFVSVIDTSVTASLLTAPDVAAVLSGKDIVEFSTGFPTAANELGERIEKAGARFLVGAIMDFPSVVGSPDCLTMYSGNQAVFDDLRSTLDVFGTAKYVGASPGIANVLDNGVLIEVGGVAFLEGLAGVVGEGGTVEALKSAVPAMMRTLSTVIESVLEQVTTENYDGEDASIDTHAELMTLNRDRLAAAGVRTDITDAMLGYLQEAQRRGLGNAELGAVYQVMRRSPSSVT
ncbi:NAD(P)-dependent oxidoreductase [Dietzia lutea]|uniref:Uncharacterized protein n=1 Tax=Dietzia lutea TaxID=546160 RepID=A0A2S1RCU4_9ACTN|nr:NAD(P)-binding domain-containing protein [Dietzia lutea]AWH94087.1 hypothetical protein A6035_17155 [Dietzia lutea]